MRVRKKQVPLVQTTVSFAQYQAFPRPAFADSIRFPNDLTQLTAANLSDLLGKYTRLYAFANAEACKCNVSLLRIDTQESLRRATLLRERPFLNNQEKWRRDSVLDCDPAIMRYQSERLLAKQNRLFAETARDNFEKYIAALSRALTQKGLSETARY